MQQHRPAPLCMRPHALPLSGHTLTHCDDTHAHTLVTHTAMKQGDISSAGSSVRVLVIPTDEELCIAQQTVEVVRAAGLNLGGGAAA